VPRPSYGLDRQPWEVVRAADGRVVHEAFKTREDAGGRTRVKGKEIRFRTSVGAPAIVVTKTFRLFPKEDGFELELGFESPERPQTLAYRLLGPHGIPIEGEWYTSTFRDAFFGKIQGNGVRIETHPASEIAAADAKGEPLSNTQVPLRFAGVENQYFTVFYAPQRPASEAHPEAEAIMTAVGARPQDLQKADISVDLVSRPIAVGPDRAATQQFLVFAGPKTKQVLAPYGAEDLTSYRKGWQLWVIGPLASQLAKYVISPMLDAISAQTKAVARLFGGSEGSYGIAIILLTITVRLLMFPLSRKQAISAKKMQDLQPLMVEIRDKYKDDKERQTRETFALYKQHGVNPVGGCLPALIQLPIFIGLWQALNNSVALRHAPFLWIDNLAAPDML
jgi:YidC/Oxa1 family membrane protein insertase